MGLYVKPMEGQELLSFLFVGGRKSYALFQKCIFRRDFLSPRTAIVLGIENYPSACMSCCSDDLALLLLHYKTFEVCGPRIYQTENKLSPLHTQNTTCTHFIKTLKLAGESWLVASFASPSQLSVTYYL